MQRLRILRVTTRPLRLQSLHTSSSLRSSWSASPSPPRLPKEEQEIFEKLQQQSTGAFSTPISSDSPTSSPSLADLRARINQSPDSLAPDISATKADGENATGQAVKVRASGEGEELHPHIRMGARPEFEGDVNPKTGEVGGPKNEPLRWGGDADWSYNGRVTDF